MKKLFVLLFALLTFSTYADPVFVVNGQAVPASSVSGTISITTGSASPPVCTPPFVPNGVGGCVCPPGTTLSGNNCVTPTPPVSGVSIRPVTFPPGNSYTSVWGNQGPRTQGNTEIVAWEFPAEALVGTNQAGNVSLYTSSAPYEACISATPGAFDSPTSKFSGSQAGDKVGISYVSWTRDAVRGYGKLPTPNASGKLYLNIRKVAKPGFENVTLAYYPLYQPQ